MQALDRARGALYGLAIGDALGMPAEMLSRAEVVARWGPLLSGFEDPPPGHPIAGGMPAGSVTDDTEQAVLLGRLLVRGRGEIDPREWAAALVDWERDMAARGRHRLLGPSTKRAVAAVLSGTPPEEAGLGGDTNGAAMRIAPVGIAFPPGALLLDRVRQSCLVTHNTPVAMAGAAAVAVAVSAGIDGAGVPAAIDKAVVAARAADRGSTARAAGESVPGTTVASRVPRISSAPSVARDADIAARVEWAVTEVPGALDEAADFIIGQVGTRVPMAESVPAAFAVLAAVPGDPWQACLLAASLGGDSDTIAAMAGAIAGACHGMSAFPGHAIATVDAHGLGLTELADSLYALRRP